jgi:hypothetical protein
MDTYLAPEPSDDDDDDEVDPFGPDSGLAAMAAFCKEARLPLPPLPAAFIPLLEQTSEGVFTSRDDLDSLADVDTLITEAAAGNGIPFVALSHEGFGVNSWYLRYCVSLPAGSLFAVIPFGGLYRDADADLEVVGTLFEQAATLIERALEYEGPKRFVVEYRGFGTGRWCEIGGAWQDDPNALMTVADALTAG